ncbi:DNA annealing helicase and endonuclease ZRANB3-like [Arachis ipaensis]|uniref:DNA annealing helicase and endonuclease ZRANB3-like n=1 Tax=Arachis ipaensis TaxID=130454 RepID=UPI000A2B43E5|nr:DNA annealing helicase and endonuclease ZRANB3-like [Arachis ipaensis]
MPFSLSLSARKLTCKFAVSKIDMDKIPSYIESKLLPFQREGVWFILQHGGRALLVDEMGLSHSGKLCRQFITRTFSYLLSALSVAIAVASRIQDSWPVLILAPSSLHLKWASVRIVLRRSPDLIEIYGETKNVRKLNIQYSILLSGTPALFRPIELFKQMEALYPDAYKNGVFGVYQGVSNHEELHNLMKVTVMIRRLNKVVLSQLPVKCRQQIMSNFLKLPLLKTVQKISHHSSLLEVVKANIKSAKSKDEGESLKFTHKNLIDKVYSFYCNIFSGLGLYASSLNHFDGTFIEGKKVGCIRIDGGRPAASRQQLVTDFREEHSIKVAVPSINAGGVGLTLTAASSYICRTILDSRFLHLRDVAQFKLDNLGLLLKNQMLDGHENTLAVSNNQPLSSPAKHTTIEHSPLRQRTLDQFVRRCDNADRSEHQPDPKRPLLTTCAYMGNSPNDDTNMPFEAEIHCTTNNRF